MDKIEDGIQKTGSKTNKRVFYTPIASGKRRIVWGHDGKENEARVHTVVACTNKSIFDLIQGTRNRPWNGLHTQIIRRLLQIGQEKKVALHHMEHKARLAADSIRK